MNATTKRKTRMAILATAAMGCLASLSACGYDAQSKSSFRYAGAVDLGDGVSEPIYEPTLDYDGRQSNRHITTITPNLWQSSSVGDPWTAELTEKGMLVNSAGIPRVVGLTMGDFKVFWGAGDDGSIEEGTLTRDEDGNPVLSFKKLNFTSSVPMAEQTKQFTAAMEEYKTFDTAKLELFKKNMEVLESLGTKGLDAFTKAVELTKLGIGL